MNALLGSVNMTLWCIEKYKPRAVVMCFGQESADYRVEAYPDYHAARPADARRPGVAVGARAGVVRGAGLEGHGHDRLEADDLMGSYAAWRPRPAGRR